MWKVPLFDFSFDREEFEAVQNVLSSGWLTMGEVTHRFEQDFADFIGVKHAYAVSSGTAALHLANMAIGLGSGDEVICPSLTFVAGANSIKYTGATPVFADIKNLNNFNISPDNIESKITSKTKAIQVVHFAGYPCDMEAIMDIAKKYKLYVIEDCAHAPGATYNNIKCGSIGNVGCFSFFSNKNITTAEGGMVTTNDDELSNKIKLMRSHGMTTLTLDRHKGRAISYDVVDLGFNYRIDEIRSSLGTQQLKKLPAANKRRQQLTKLYNKNLSTSTVFDIPFQDTSGISTCHIFPVLLKENIVRQDFMNYLKNKGIQTSIHYPSIHQFKYYKKEYGYEKGSLPFTEKVSDREVTLPLYPSMKDEDVRYVCGTINKYNSD